MTNTDKRRPSRNARLLTDEEVEERREVLLEGIAQFNDGYFFQSHETWEDFWLRCPLPARTFLQGLIQIAAAFVHLRRREYKGTVKLLGHGLSKLEDLPDDYLGVDVKRLISDVEAAREAIIALGPDGFAEWDGVPRVHLADITESCPRARPTSGR